MEAKITRRTDEEGLEDVAVRYLVDLRGHVEHPAYRRHTSSEVQKTVQVEGCNLSVVALVVRKVEVIRKRLLLPWKP